MHIHKKTALTFTGLVCGFLAHTAMAEDNSPLPPSEIASQQQYPEQNWVDTQHEDVQHHLNTWANKMDGWFGKPNPEEPASANLRIIMDTRWNKYDDVTVEPRIRGKLRLPVLEHKLSLVIGDDSLDEEKLLQNDTSSSNPQPEEGKVIDREQTRNDNASIALRWTKFGAKLGLTTDIDIGVHSIDDVFIRIEADKDVQLSDKLSLNSDNTYRYGSESEHYARTNLRLAYTNSSTRHISNSTNITYTNKNETENVSWGNSTRQIHQWKDNRQLSYGLSASGDINSGSVDINSYGPVISYRQPIWRDWLYLQTEATYYNDESKDRNHYPAGLVRVEALF